MKKIGVRYARLSAAVVAAIWSASAAHGQTVTWDPSGVSPPADGAGNWDTTSSQWFNGTTAVAWSNATPDSAVLGTGTSASSSPFIVALNANITVQDLTLANASATSYYSIADQGDGLETLTLAGNIIKSSNVGTSVFQLTNPMVLTAGDHVVAANDTPGQVPEVVFDSPITGSGSITMNNAFNSSGYTQFGALVLNVDNTYSGGTNLVSGAIFANTSNALGTGTVNIGNQGVLQFGGEGTTQAAVMNVTNPIFISRNTYTGTNFNDYPDAIISANTGNAGNVATFSGPFIVDSTDARVAANTSTIIISSSLQQGPDVVGTNSGVLTLDGDFAGFVTLSGNNTGWGGAIQLIGGVELNASSLANIGGPTGALIFNGSGTFHPVGGFITNFGTLNVNYSTFSAGIDVDPGQSFTINQNLGGAGNTSGSVGERGTGTLNLGGTDILGGTTFWDNGTVNVTGTMSLGSLHLRSPVVNISGSVATTSGYSSFGQDTTGTNGGPDMATVNLLSGGSLTLVGGNDFNVSDNNNTSGTINVEPGSTLTVGGNFFVSKNSGTHGTINQTGGVVNANGGGGQSLDIGQGAGSNGVYDISNGSLTVAGELWVGNNPSSATNNEGNGTFNQTGGSVTVNSWVAIGRFGSVGTFNLSGGTFTKQGGNNAYVGENINSITSTVNVTLNGVFNETSGEFWVGQGGGVGVLNIGTAAGALTNADANASFTVNSWFAIGRNGGTGTLNLYDGTVTQKSANFFDVGAGGNGTANVFGGNLNAFQTYVAENNGSTGMLNVSGGTVSLGNTTIGNTGNASGTLTVSGGTVSLGNTTIGNINTASGVLNVSNGAVSLGAVIFANANSATGQINLNGGTLSATGFTAQNGGGTGIGKFFFNGGTLTTTANNVNNNFIGAKVTSVVSTGGAIVNANGGYININSALTHDSTLGGADGGLTVIGTGTVQLGTSGSHTPLNTYTGPTTVQGGTLIVSTVGALPSGSNVANSAAFVVGANSTAGNVSGTGTTTVSAAATFTASNFTQGGLANNGTVTVNGSGTVGPISGAGTLTVNGSLHLATSSGLSTMGSLSVGATGTFDVNNNHIIINYGAGPDPIASIAALLTTGYAGGAWNGAGGITSTAAAANTLSYGLGYADSADPGNPAGLSSGTLEIAYTLLGDTDLNGVVNGIDFGILAANFNKGVSRWDQGDFNYDGVVNGVDFGYLAANFNKGASGASGGASASDFAALDQFAAANGLLADVPEPASLGLVAAGAAGLLARRRRRSNA